MVARTWWLLVLGLFFGGPSTPWAQRTQVRVERDVAFLEAGRVERLDLYHPVGLEEGELAPAVLIVHGGGWYKGSKSDRREQEMGRTLARAGYLCASVDYLLRTDEQAPWPRNLLDCKTAVQYLRVNAERLRIDPERIGAIGSSAGGHLVSMLGVTDPSHELEPDGPYEGVSSRMRAVVDFYGVTSFLTRQETDATGRPTGAPKDGPIPGLLGVGRDEDPELWRFASPVTHVSEDDPPFLIVHGLADTTVDYEQSKTLAKHLGEAGVENELLLIEGIGHSFGFRYWERKPVPEVVEERVLSFFGEHLAEAPADEAEGEAGE